MIATKLDWLRWRHSFSKNMESNLEDRLAKGKNPLLLLRKKEKDFDEVSCHCWLGS